MANRPTILVSLLVTVSAVLGCGVVPTGQARSWSFTVSGFSLPVNMAYSDSPTVRTQFSGFSATREAASSLVSRLVMQTVTDVLEQQGGSAGLPDFVISNILSQLTIRTSYDPLECKDASGIDAQSKTTAVKMPPQCVIVSGTVTSYVHFSDAYAV
ncbi:hypothetical protein KIN20_027943 [Parelaphostrongylus tenuis]|uniref:Uncharacterized protein n=1 Tax=Parelaphostrongylus tenuis TaxID=148309 RepID=A0AAD5R094_PARTN|nr:hypothetical protein KIN20_027943 [Parelaphostrongylus tenuis]